MKVHFFIQFLGTAYITYMKTKGLLSLVACPTIYQFFNRLLSEIWIEPAERAS
jgi:hypothetical protein